MAPGTLLVTDADTRWQTGNLAVGFASPGTLQIQDGAKLVSGLVRIGHADAPGTVVIRDSAGGTRTSWDIAETLTVGHSGTGRLFVEDGGIVSADRLEIGHSPSNVEGVWVEGFNAADERSILIIDRDIHVGTAGAGMLRVVAGAAAASLASINIGLDGPGFVGVSGFHVHPGENLPSTPSASETLHVGVASMGTLHITEGALVTSKIGIVGGLREGIEGHVLVAGEGDGQPSTWRVDEGLTVGNDAPGTIRLQGGRVEAKAIGVGNFGRVEGVGTLAVALDHRFVVLDGEIAPGLSAGTLTIDGYAPRMGDTFSFLEAGGDLTGEFLEVRFPNLQPGFELSAPVFANGIYSFTALKDGELLPDNRLRFQLEKAGLQLSWDLGVLQSAPRMDGPWEGVLETASPWFVQPDQPALFYRIELPSDKP